MPLAFESLSHGTIAFGFFNIESDMLLLDRYFLFAGDFCNYVGDIAECDGQQPYHKLWPVQFIENAEDIGDLMGAIHGVRFTGFIGELYRHFPFPQLAEDFKQNPAGYQTQSFVLKIIVNYAQHQKISVAVSDDGRQIQMGAYRFNRIQFQEIVKYVWLGGYPRWKGEIRPDYVLTMKDKIIKNSKRLFADLVIDS